MTKPTAAGILFVHDGYVLLLKRAGAPHRGTWGFPGGGIEAGETPEQAARRETREEIGMTYDGPLRSLWVSPDGFECFGAALDERLPVELNHEHSAARWAWFDELPSPLHPSTIEELSKMPLIEGKSDKVRSENIGKEIGAGKDPKQAAAIAYSIQRKAARANDIDVFKHPAQASAAAQSIASHAKDAVDPFAELFATIERIC